MRYRQTEAMTGYSGPVYGLEGMIHSIGMSPDAGMSPGVLKSQRENAADRFVDSTVYMSSPPQIVPSKKGMKSNAIPNKVDVRFKSRSDLVVLTVNGPDWGVKDPLYYILNPLDPDGLVSSLKEKIGRPSKTRRSR